MAPADACSEDELRDENTKLERIVADFSLDQSDAAGCCAKKW
jgi:hypothetical protein